MHTFSSHIQKYTHIYVLRIPFIKFFFTFFSSYSSLSTSFILNSVPSLYIFKAHYRCSLFHKLQLGKQCQIYLRFYFTRKENSLDEWCLYRNKTLEVGPNSISLSSFFFHLHQKTYWKKAEKEKQNPIKSNLDFNCFIDSNFIAGN